MCPKDVNDYLEKGLYGSPQIKPEEKNTYLGTFRERIYLAMTVSEMKKNENVTLLKKYLQDNPGHQLLLNGDLDFSDQSVYMAVAQKNNISFKIVDTDKDLTLEDIGLVYATNEAVNQENISIERFKSKTTTEKNTLEDEPTENFFKRIWMKLFKK
ncbi:YueI family protein [Vagococcus coleopterorum]|uniref:YueI family protein n=1 Tax=Vagococcus coleopterorum TaxID=2714946 RepID=A0A6G8AM62_9ENTE|nr:YueI family protein [Vagococcus coleopterorum]QIL46087.1 YueI family protein [Vagococcus coleopterorum]